MEDCFACGGGDVDQQQIDHIKEFGLSVIGTEEIVDGFRIPLTYSIGITSTLGKPEVVVYGLPTKHAHIFINMYYARIKAGEMLIPGVEYDDFAADGFKLQFKEITRESYASSLIQAKYYNDSRNIELKAYQLIYPDADGNWPWDPEVDDMFKTNANVLP